MRGFLSVCGTSPRSTNIGAHSVLRTVVFSGGTRIKAQGPRVQEPSGFSAVCWNVRHLRRGELKGGPLKSRCGIGNRARNLGY